MHLLTLALLVGGADSADLVDVATLDARFTIDVRYATTDNFTGQVLYPVNRCLLRKEVAAMVVKAQAFLDQKHPGYVLLFKDCLRPERIQKIMWDVVKGTPEQSYVANPYGKTGSVHNYGCAVDLTLSKAGQEVDMGTKYDFFGKLAEPRHEAKFLKEGKLTQAQVDNRKILRTAMTHGGGFKGLKNEWWHFDALQGKALRKKYGKVDVPLDVKLD